VSQRELGKREEGKTGSGKRGREVLCGLVEF